MGGGEAGLEWIAQGDPAEVVDPSMVIVIQRVAAATAGGLSE